jgi:hypothetical protein
MAFTDGADAVGPQIDSSAGGGEGPSGPGPGAGGQPGGAPPGGGPILASLAKRMQGPQTSAPGPGDQASAMTMVTTALGMLNQAIPGLQPGQPIYRDVLRAAQMLSKHAAQGGPGAGVQATQLQDLLRNVMKNALLSRIMGQQQQKPGGGSPDQPAGASPLPGASAQAPMPSTPLPGA